MAYNTGNPLGSIDARDLYDNAQNMDKAVNQTTARWSDRFGVSRPSWAGMSHYNNVGEYAADILITGYNEVFRYDGEFYRAAAATVLPYTTTGSWSEDGPLFVSVGDAVLRHDIAYEADMYIGYYRNAINCNQYGGLEAAVADADTLGKTIIVTDTQDVSIPLDFTGRDLAVDGGLITFSGTGSITGIKETRPEWFGVNTTPGTTDMTDAANLAFLVILNSGGGKVSFLPYQKYRLDATVLVDGDNAAVIEIDAATSEFYFYGTGAAFKFLDTEYPLANLGSIFVVNDTIGTYGVHFKHCRWGDIKADIFNGENKAAASWSVNNTGFYLESGPTDAYDNLYNKISGRARRTGWSLWLENLDTAYTRNNANEFDIEYGGTNGIKIRGCVGNFFRGSLESGTGSPISLLLNDDGIKTRYNTFDFRWVENASMTAWAPESDAGCDDNVFFVRNLQYGTFAIPGRQQITYNGNDGNTNDTTHLIQSQETEEAQLAGGYMGGVNLLGATDDFSNAAWTKSNVTVSAGAVALPDGTSVSDKNTITLGSANGTVNQTVTYNTANKRLTASVWLKASTPHVARFQIYSNAGGGTGQTRYCYVTTSWRRYHLTFSFGSDAGTSVGLYIYPAYTGVATGVINVFGPQLNEGYPGAYMGGGTNAAARKLGTCGQIGTNNAVVTPLIGFSKYQDTGGYNNNYRIIGYATAAPAAGTWVAGDRLFHSSPEEAGTAGSKYIIDGWACTASGTPGTWVQCRTLTGN